MKMSRILALVMALVMLCSMPAMAEAKLHTVTVNNIAIQQNADQVTELGVELALSGGGEDEQAYVNIAAAGDGNPIVNAEFEVRDGNITMAMDGLTNNYTISKDDIEKLMEQSQSQDMPFDAADVQDLMASYMEALKQAAEMGDQPLSEEEMAAYYEDAGYTVGGEETVTVNGIEMTLPRYDLDLDAQGMDKFFQASLNRFPAMKEFMEKYMAFIEKVAASSGDAVDFDPEHMFSSFYSQTGMDMRIKATLWTDAKAENMRMEMEEIMTEIPSGTEPAEAATEPVTVIIPITMQVNTDERGRHMIMNMDMDQLGVRMTMNFKINDAKLPEGAKGNFNFDMTVMDEAISIVGDYNYDAAGKGSMNCELSVPMGEGAVSRNSVQVTSTGGDVNTSSVQLRTMQLQQSGAIMKELSRLTIGFDVTVQAGALPQAALIENGKPSVNIPSMTEEQQDEAMQELMTKGIQAYGQLMATEGVSKLLTDLVMLAAEAFDTYSESLSTAA